MDGIEIIAENLAEAESLLCEGWELRLAHLKELSAGLFDRRAVGGRRAGSEPPSREQVTDLYRTCVRKLSEKRAEQVAPPDRSPEGRAAFAGLTAELDLHSRLTLAREWAASDDPMPLAECSPSDGGYTVAHFGNLYADTALSGFVKALGSASVYPSEDYTAACEEVSDGNADFCILPVESARDGVMDRFEQMIDRYSLFVLMTCSVRLSEENEDEWIRYALLAGLPCRLGGPEQPATDRVQIRITRSGEALWELLLAAELVGAKLLECRLSGRSADRAATYRLTFSANEQSRSELLAYLELGYSGYTLTGAYRELNDLPLEV